MGLILLAMLLPSAYFLAERHFQDAQNRQKQEEASRLYSDMVERFKTPEPTAIATPTLTPKPSEKTPDPTPTPKTIKPEFLELQKHYNNGDIVGYLKIEDTTIDYPIVQAEDNDYYLDRDIDKNNSSAGWIYMDYENDVFREDKNIVLYGHNMNRDFMFHSLRRYADEEYFKNHRYITFNTLYDDGVWEVFSFYRTMTSFQYITVMFNDQQEFENLLFEMKSRSMYDTGVEVSGSDRILTLSTCSNAHEDERFVVNARLMSPEEVKQLEKETK